ncbi:helicase-related protein [Tsukamurella soli]|uniref:Helicase n=1 Tax=Tsukamurella soli TaxID=644556 RepID=A0ABP8K2Q8_9ACTN
MTNDPDVTLGGLRPFQRDTVDHVTERFFGADPTRRFLVADETGLGKTLVARGVIARAAERKDGPFTVVYVCSNLDLARQNVIRLGGDGDIHQITTRLSLINQERRRPKNGGRRGIEIIALSPRTSAPTSGNQTGIGDERALLLMLLQDGLQLTGRRKLSAHMLLHGAKKPATFLTAAERYRARHRANIAQSVDERFIQLLESTVEEGLSDRERFDEMLDELMPRRGRLAATPEPPKERAGELRSLIGRMRGNLARLGAESLHPDLVILDEFQRFTDILNSDSDLGSTASGLFAHDTARVLLLSATPFASFGERGDDGLDLHHDDFVTTIEKLADGGSDTDRPARIGSLLSRYRNELTSHQDPTATGQQIRSELLALLCRTERPASAVDSMVAEPAPSPAVVDPTDVASWVGLRKLAQRVDARLPLDLWKSVPHLAHFMGDYQVGRKTAAQLDDPETGQTAGVARSIDGEAVKRFEPIPLGNARLRALTSDTTENGLWRLVWMPPSLPYLTPGGPFAEVDAHEISKRLVFSSWTAAPTSISTLLSYDVNARIAEASGQHHEYDTEKLRSHTRLTYRVEADRQRSMSAFILFFPFPELATVGDPLAAAHREGGMASPDALEADVARSLVAADSRPLAPWLLALSYPDPLLHSVVSRLDNGGIADALTTEDDAGRALRAHAQLARDTVGAADRRGEPHPATVDDARLVAQIAAHSPANCAWRALGRLPRDTSSVSPTARWQAAATIATALRSVFNRWDSALLLDGLYAPGSDGDSYWQRVLRYCADGNLQAVLDEYLFQLCQERGSGRVDDTEIRKIAEDAATAISLPAASHRAHDPADPRGEGIEFFGSRFARQYTKAADDASVRPATVRAAFNSPFWPFVLATTSAGQEGIDFHTWCHTVVHWNVPANPVDFEQREGRVNRFRGHAVRKNIAEAHGPQMRQSENPWATGYDLAAQALGAAEEVPGLRPDWIYPGKHKINREVLPYQLSVDAAKLQRTRRRVALYRLAFGQQRQEDLVETLDASDLSDADADRFRIDLRPPGSR